MFPFRLLCRLFIAVCLCLFVTVPYAIAQKPIERVTPLHEKPILGATKRFERKTVYLDVGDTRRQMNYYWYAPQPPYPDGLEFPLVVILHGSTGYSYTGKYLTEPNVSVQYPAFILIPMAPERALWSYPERVSNYTQEFPHVVKLIEQLSASYPIDKKRFYAVGCSMGGYGVFGVANFYSHIFAAGVSISGEWYPQCAKDMLTMPIRC